jgi:Flp pilus assembly protein TadG
MRSFRRRGEDQGSAAVEFALVLPVLMLILFGIIDFGRMLNARITLSQAANEGARAVAVVGDDAAAGVMDAIMGATPYTVDEIDGCDSPLDDARVTLSHAFTFTTPFVGGDDGMGLTATAVVPCL